MERNTTTRPTALYVMTIRQDATGYIRRRTYRLTDEKYKGFAKLLNVPQNGFTLLEIQEDI
jgi:hypothetical protein